MWLIALVSSLSAPATALPAFPVDMVTEYCWDGIPCGEVVWTLEEDGSGEDSSGNDARWRYRRSTLRWEYTETGTTYLGTFDGECFVGEMRRLSGDFGTFTACRS